MPAASETSCRLGSTWELCNLQPLPWGVQRYADVQSLCMISTRSPLACINSERRVGLPVGNHHNLNHNGRNCWLPHSADQVSCAKSHSMTKDPKGSFRQTPVVPAKFNRAEARNGTLRCQNSDSNGWFPLGSVRGSPGRGPSTHAACRFKHPAGISKPKIH